MPETEDLKIPKPPDTMRATPAAIARELEPVFDRVTEMFAARFDSVDRLLAQIGAALEHAAARDKLLFDELSSLKEQIALHDQRLRALERIPRLPVRVEQRKKKAKRRAARQK